MQPLSGRDILDRIRSALTWQPESHVSGLARAFCLIGMFTSVNTIRAYWHVSFGKVWCLRCTLLNAFLAFGQKMRVVYRVV